MNTAQHAVGNGAGLARDLLRVDGHVAFGAQYRHCVADRHEGAMRDVDGGDIHRDGAYDRGEMTFGDYAPAAGETMRDAVRVARGQNGDARGMRRAVHTTIADQRAG